MRYRRSGPTPTSSASKPPLADELAGSRQALARSAPQGSPVGRAPRSSRRRHGIAEPRREHRGTVLEQLAVGEHRWRPGGERRLRSSRSSCWPTRQHPRARLARPRDRRDAVVGPRGQVDDREVGADERRDRARGAVFARAGSPPAASTARRGGRARSGRGRGRRRAAGSSPRRPVGREVAEHVAGRHDADRAVALDDRDVAEPADGHLVDRDGHRLVARGARPGRGS